jgi:hypothetical protein
MDTTTTVIIIILALAIANSTGIIGRAIQFSAILYSFVVIKTFMNTLDFKYLALNIIGLSFIFILYTIKHGIPLILNILKIFFKITKKGMETIKNAYKKRKYKDEEYAYTKPDNQNPYREEAKTDPHKRLCETLYDYEYFKKIAERQK